MNTRFAVRPYAVEYSINSLERRPYQVNAYTAEDAFFQAQLELGKMATIYKVIPFQMVAKKPEDDWRDL